MTARAPLRVLAAGWAFAALVTGSVPGALAALPPVADSAAQLQAALAARDWRLGGTLCDRLAIEEARRGNRGKVPASHYALLAARCAAVAGGGSHPAGVEWWWYTAIAMDPKAALDERASLRVGGFSIPVSPPRSLAPKAAASRPGSERVRLTDGRIVAGTPAGAMNSAVPEYMVAPAMVESAAVIVIEVVVGIDGMPRQPVLRSAARAKPVHAFLALRYLRDWRFLPALVDGVPVVSVAEPVTISFSKSER